MIAATIAGKGEVAPFKFFTRQDGKYLSIIVIKCITILCTYIVPRVSPVVTTSNRASADQVYVTWNKLNDDDIQGFFVDYVVKYYTSAVHGDCSSPKNEMTETTTDEYILLQNLDPTQRTVSRLLQHLPREQECTLTSFMLMVSFIERFR